MFQFCSFRKTSFSQLIFERGGDEMEAAFVC